MQTGLDAGHRLPNGEALKTPGGSPGGLEKGFVDLVATVANDEHDELLEKIEAGA